MNFSSLKEYFYKLYNASMKRVLIPLAVYLAIYYFFLSGMILPVIWEDKIVIALLAVYPVVIVVSLTIVHLEVRKLLKAKMDLVGLGNKLDFFYLITKKKMKTMLWVSLFSATGFALTFHPWFNIYFALILVWYFFQWPSPRKASNLLRLKGDEREMVMTKGEAFRF
jgi:hypothetical protein